MRGFGRLAVDAVDIPSAISMKGGGVGGRTSFVRYMYVSKLTYCSSGVSRSIRRKLSSTAREGRGWEANGRWTKS